MENIIWAGIIICIVIIMIKEIFGKEFESLKAEEYDGCCEECHESHYVKDSKNTITQNIYKNRNGKRQKVGVLVSKNKNGKILVGYSVCHKHDDFNIHEAYVLAGKRMTESVLNPPNSINSDLKKFFGRCMRYYKNADLPAYDGVTITNR